MKTSAALSFFEQPNRLLLLTLILATTLAFWKLGSHPIADWDEARQGVNAYEMAENGHYFDYYYWGELDTWSAKPPLMIWSIVASQKVFGMNAFGLRFPAALATILFFFLAFRLVRLYKGDFFAFGVCWILMSCYAILGEHVGRTADYDAFLLPSLTGFAYCFALFHDFQKPKALLMGGVFLGLAFYSKGTAAVFLIPGAILYVLLSGTFLKTIKSRYLWACLVIFIGIAASWIYLSSTFGERFANNMHGGGSAIKTMLFYDTIERFSSESFQGYQSDPFFFFSAIDIKMNVWNYLFYAAILLGIVSLIQKRDQLKTFIRAKENRLVLLSFCMVFCLAVVLSISKSKFGWYLAPVFLFMAVLMHTFVGWCTSKITAAKLVFAALFIGLFARHFLALNDPKPDFGNWIAEHAQGSNDVWVYQSQKQSLLLQLYWKYGSNIHFTASDTIFKDPIKGKAIYFEEGAQLPTPPTECYEGICIIQ